MTESRKVLEIHQPGNIKRERPKKRHFDVAKDGMQKVGARDVGTLARRVWRIRYGAPGRNAERRRRTTRQYYRSTKQTLEGVDADRKLRRWT